MAYSFEFGDITFSEQDELVWLLAEGEGIQTNDDGATATFPYRLTGVLTKEDATWRWLLLADSEPTPG
jgi:ketosteroid isomerase-like protein